MCHENNLPSQVSVWLIALVGGLVQIDQKLAAEARARGCPHCGGGRLDQASYPRKSRGIPVEHEALFARRLSLCCARPGCRKRTTPPSVRFLGRRLYAAPCVVLAVACAESAKAMALPRRTARRWTTWWRTVLPRTVFWQAARAHLMPPVDERALPASLLERFTGELLERLSALLTFIAPMSIGAHRARMAVGQ